MDWGSRKHLASANWLKSCHTMRPLHTKPKLGCLFSLSLSTLSPLHFSFIKKSNPTQIRSTSTKSWRSFFLSILSSLPPCSSLLHSRLGKIGNPSEAHFRWEGRHSVGNRGRLRESDKASALGWQSRSQGEVCRSLNSLFSTSKSLVIGANCHNQRALSLTARERERERKKVKNIALSLLHREQSTR